MRRYLPGFFLWVMAIGIACAPVDRVDSTVPPTIGPEQAAATGYAALSPISPSATSEADAAYPGFDPAEPGSDGYPGLLVTAPPALLDGDLSTTPPASGGDGSMTGSMPVPSTPPAALMELITAVARDLSRRTDLPLDELSFISAEAMTWPDTSLGCPDPDLLYAEVITEGYRVIMAGGQRLYVYHTDNNDNIVLCLDDRPAGAEE